MTDIKSLVGFEDEVKSLWESGELPFLLHLCGGNESQLIGIFQDIKPGDWVFSTHRSHYHYLLAGGSPVRLLHKIKVGDSMFIFDKTINFFTSSILAGTCGIACGVALAIKMAGLNNAVFCFVGDGAEEQGHFYEAVTYVHGHSLPCLFIIEDNDRSVTTNKEQRRGSESAINWPRNCVKRYSYTPTYPHAGSGCKQHITFKTK